MFDNLGNHIVGKTIKSANVDCGRFLIEFTDGSFFSSCGMAKTGWIPFEPDSRGLTNTFKCPECGMLVTLDVYDNTCEYDYCPYCGASVPENGDADNTAG